MWRNNWWWKLLTGSFLRDRFDKLIKYCAELVNDNNSYSSHRAINITWGVGSFLGFWVDHFWFHRGAFTHWELGFIIAMAGVQTTSALVSKSIQLNSSARTVTSTTETADATTTNKFIK